MEVDRLDRLDRSLFARTNSLHKKPGDQPDQPDFFLSNGPDLIDQVAPVAQVDRPQGDDQVDFSSQLIDQVHQVNRCAALRILQKNHESEQIK